MLGDEQIVKILMGYTFFQNSGPIRCSLSSCVAHSKWEVTEVR